MTETPTIGNLVAAYSAAASATPLPDEVVARAKLHVLDSLAAVVSGAALEAGLAGQAYVRALKGPALATVLGSREKAPLVEAALANGMAAHADESDDSHESSQTHPGCGVVPAAMVVAEVERSSGQDLVRSVVLGYEMTIRFATALGAAMSFKSSSLSSHAYGPLFGAGYAAGSLMRFDEKQFRVLLNYLAQEASGLTTWRLDQRHTLKSYVFGGMPASNGVKAAALVQAGFTGDGDALDLSKRNMLDAISPAPNATVLTDALGTRHAVMETDIKRYPVGYPIASPLAALEAILAKPGFDARGVTDIRVFYNEDWYKVIGDESRMPDVNLRYCLSVTVIDGALSFNAAHDAERMTQADVVAMGRLIRMLPPKPHQDRFAVRIEVDSGGRTFAVEQDRYVLGRTENFMSRKQVHDKAEELLSTVLTTERARSIIQLVDRLETQPSLEPLIALMRLP